MPTVNEISLKYREQFLKNQATLEGQFRGVFNKVAQDISRLAADPNARFTKAFNFNKPIKVKIDGIIQNFQNQTLGLTEKMISDSWDISNSKNDEIVRNYLSTVTGLKTAETVNYFLPNTPALEAFISRANNATTLADTVWNISKQARAEMETHLGIGIVNGDSAQVISQRIRQYLNNPQALFRRVRDKNGKLIASQAMRENKPGQGVYNSAYKNAMRVARTETNMAYLLSDNLRWQQNDMVLGVRISLSDQHKIVDICDDLIGDYPKYFVWVGWHIQDLCNATPILMPKADFEKYLQSGGKLPKGKQITEMPENFKEYMKANIDRFEGYKSQPYFITDNKAIIDGIVKGGVKNVVSPIAGIVEQAVKTEFVAAKSIDEAKLWASTNLGIKKDVASLLNLDARNTINQRIFELKNEYVNKLSYFGDVSGQTIGRASPFEMDFNKTYFNNPDFFEKQMLKSEISGFHPIGSSINPAKGIIDHEFGHVLTNNDLYVFNGQKSLFRKEIDTIKSAYKKEMNKIYSDAQIQQVRNPLEKINPFNLVKSNVNYISEYANKNIDEFVAESFTEALNNPNPSKYALDVLKTIDKYYKK